MIKVSTEAESRNARTQNNEVWPSHEEAPSWEVVAKHTSKFRWVPYSLPNSLSSPLALLYLFMTPVFSLLFSVVSVFALAAEESPFSKKKVVCDLETLHAWPGFEASDHADPVIPREKQWLGWFCWIPTLKLDSFISVWTRKLCEMVASEWFLSKRSERVFLRDVAFLLTTQAQGPARPAASGPQAAGPRPGQGQEEHLALQDRPPRRGWPLHRYFGKTTFSLFLREMATRKKGPC